MSDDDGSSGGSIRSIDEYLAKKELRKYAQSKCTKEIEGFALNKL